MHKWETLIYLELCICQWMSTMDMYVCIYIYNVRVVLIHPLTIKYANFPELLTTPRNKVRQPILALCFFLFVCSCFFLKCCFRFFFFDFFMFFHGFTSNVFFVFSCEFSCFVVCFFWSCFFFTFCFSFFLVVFFLLPLPWHFSFHSNPQIKGPLNRIF